MSTPISDDEMDQTNMTGDGDDCWLPSPSKRIRRRAAPLHPLVPPTSKRRQKINLPEGGRGGIVCKKASLAKSQKTVRQCDIILLDDDNSSSLLLPPPSPRNKRSKPSGTPLHPLALPRSKKICNDNKFHMSDDKTDGYVPLYDDTVGDYMPVITGSTLTPAMTTDISLENTVALVLPPPILKIDSDCLSRILYFCNWGESDLNVVSGLNVAVFLYMCGDTNLSMMLSGIRRDDLTLTIHMGERRELVGIKPSGEDWLIRSIFSTNSRRYRDDPVVCDMLDFLKPTNVRIDFYRKYGPHWACEAMPDAGDFDNDEEYERLDNLISSLPDCVKSLEYLSDESAAGVSRILESICFADSNFNSNLERLVIGTDVTWSTTHLHFTDGFIDGTSLSHHLPLLHTLIISDLEGMAGFVDNLPLPHDTKWMYESEKLCHINCSALPASIRILCMPRYNIVMQNGESLSHLESVHYAGFPPPPQ